MPKRHRQLWVKDLPKVPMWRLERGSNLWPFGREETNLPMSHHAPLLSHDVNIWLHVALPTALSFCCYSLPSCIETPRSGYFTDHARIRGGVVRYGCIHPEGILIIFNTVQIACCLRWVWKAHSLLKNLPNSDVGALIEQNPLPRVHSWVNACSP